MAKGLFIACHSRPDLIIIISVLAGRVREPNKTDRAKGERLIRYLQGTKDLHLILHYDGLNITRWHVDASFAVHPDFRSHSGGTLLLHPGGRGIASGSVKQKLNTRSYTT